MYSSSRRAPGSSWSFLPMIGELCSSICTLPAPPRPCSSVKPLHNIDEPREPSLSSQTPAEIPNDHHCWFSFAIRERESTCILRAPETCSSFLTTPSRLLGSRSGGAALTLATNPHQPRRHVANKPAQTRSAQVHLGQFVSSSQVPWLLISIKPSVPLFQSLASPISTINNRKPT